MKTVISLLALGTTLLLLAAATVHLPSARSLAPALPRDCQAGRTTFTSDQPPALPGEWHGGHGFFAIPGTLELEFCRPGHLVIQARGDRSDNGGAPLLIAQSDQGQVERPVSTAETISVPVGSSGRVILAFPNDETDALYRIVTIERLSVAGSRTCRSALIRDTRVDFQDSVTGAVYDERGQRLEPCTTGTLFLTVSGSVVDGAGPELQVTQSGRTLLTREIRGRVSLRLPLASVDSVRLAVTNFAGRKVRYRNLFLDRVVFTPR